MPCQGATRPLLGRWVASKVTGMLSPRPNRWASRAQMTRMRLRRLLRLHMQIHTTRREVHNCRRAHGTQADVKPSSTLTERLGLNVTLSLSLGL